MNNNHAINFAGLAHSVSLSPESGRSSLTFRADGGEFSASAGPERMARCQT